MNDEVNSTPSGLGKMKHPHSIKILVGFLLLIILISIFFIYRQPFTKNKIPLLLESQQNLIPNNNNTLDIASGISNDHALPPPQLSIDYEQNKILSKNNNTLDAYYYRDMGSTIYKFPLTPEGLIVNTHSLSSIKGFHGAEIDTAPWKEKTVTYAANFKTFAEIYSLDLSVENSQPKKLLTFPFDSDREESIRQVKFIDNGTAIAFIVLSNVRADSPNTTLYVVSLEDQSIKESYSLSKMTGSALAFVLLAKTSDDKILYLDETYDGSYHAWYKLDRTTKMIKQLDGLPPYGDYGRPTPFSFSPDGSRFAYAFYSTEDFDDVEASEVDRLYGIPNHCYGYVNSASKKYQSEGGIIMIHNFETGNDYEVFRNLSTYLSNRCDVTVRKIRSLRWLDNSHIIFETIEGVFVLDVNTRQSRPIYVFKEATFPPPDAWDRIQHIQLPYVVFSDGSIGNINTGESFDTAIPNIVNINFFQTHYFQ